jgi:DNA-binding NarL/FixJ family response regulator
MTILTDKELEFIKLLRQGLKMKEIASLMFVSIETLDKLARELREKTETYNGKHLIDWCYQNGILKINTENIPNEERKTG